MAHTTLLWSLGVAGWIASSTSAQSPAGADWFVEGQQAGAHLGCSVASAGDINGDRYDDVVVGARDFTNAYASEGRSMVFLGSAAGLSSTPSWSVLGGTANMEMGVTVASAGDVNGDSFDDVLVYSSRNFAPQVNEGGVSLFLGSPSGLAASAAWSAESNRTGAFFGFALSAIGDVDGDGFADVLIGAPGWNGGRGAAFIYRGTASGLDASPWWSFVGPTESSFGGTVAGVGDINGDGISEILIGAQFYDVGPANDDRGAVYGFFSTPSSYNSSTPDWFISGVSGGGLGNSVASAGDVNADGRPDVLVAAQRFDQPGLTNAGRVYLYTGVPGGFSQSPAWFATGTQGQQFFGASVAGIGYHDDDRYADVAIGARYFSSGEASEGAVFVYSGTSSGLAGAPVQTIQSDEAGAQLGFPVAGAGDVDRNGGNELLAGAWLYGEGALLDEGLAVLYYGAPHVPVTYYVNAAATPPFDGTFAHPFQNIEVGWPYVRDGDTFLVAPGNYGGFAIVGKEVSVVGIGSAAATIVDHFGSPGSVVSIRDAGGRACRLANLTIRGTGGLWPYGSDARGGGIYCANSAPTIEDCVIASNVAMAQPGGGGYGGGLYADGLSAPLLRRCRIEGNACGGQDEGTGQGGGVYGPATLDDCDVIGNHAYERGGGLALCTAVNCRIVGNSVGSNPVQTSWGGGAADCMLIDCALMGNVAGYYDPVYYYGEAYGGGAAGGSLMRCSLIDNHVEGVGLNLYGPDLGGGGVAFATVTECEFKGNTVEAASPLAGTSVGGGAFSCTLNKCVFWFNHADYGGGAGNSGGTVRRCTFVANIARASGGGCSGGASVDSSILWRNEPDQLDPSASPQLTWCDVDDGALATGTNFQADPLFWNDNTGEFHLRPGSPCIDAGNPSAALDPDGSRADVGAFAFDSGFCPTTVVYCTAKTNSLGCVPAVGWSGGPSASSAAPFWITCTNVINQKTGIFFYGNARNSAPFQGGLLCVAQPIRRSHQLFSAGTASGADCSGDFSYDFNGHIQSGANPSLVLGARVEGQFWYRDPNAPFTTGLSNAIEFVICY